MCRYARKQSSAGKEMRQQFLYYQLLKYSGQGTSVGDALDRSVDRLCGSQLLELAEVPVTLRLSALKQVCQVRRTFDIIQPEIERSPSSATSDPSPGFSPKDF